RGHPRRTNAPKAAVTKESYTPLTEELISQLESIVGPDAVLTDGESRQTYASDETEDYVFPPEAVVKPGTADEISEILKLANVHRIPVTPRGGGTGLSGGALAVHGGICLSLERMNRIREINREDFYAVVEAGVITQTFQEEVESIGLFYPPDPASRGTSQLGGNLAECAGGPRAVKYGVTKDYVLGFEAVLPNGEIMRTGAPVLKNVTGYNLTQLIIGSEGTLAIVTSIVLRLISLPRFRKVLLAAFPSLEDATTAVADIFQRGASPSALEFLERAAVRVAEERLGRTFPNGDAGAQLFLEVDGNHEEGVQEEILKIAGVLEDHHAVDVLMAEEQQKMEEVWNLRRGIGEAVKSISPYKEEDTVVPRSRLPELVKGVKEICQRYRLTSICYGHAGDGNVHVNILKERLDDAAWRDASERAVREIFQLTVSLGGTISGEHGIGYSQKPYLTMALSPVEIRIMKGIKQVFDPHNILNPGKILPDG
ncbi:MAG: FAD-linked oxidase C-terminal domain-containing protein, partial [Bacteroidota bacterium]